MQLTPIIEGPADAETLFFLQGWPDEAAMWDPQVAALSSRYRCVRVTMPNFGATRDERWGYRTDEIIDALAALIERVSPGRPVTLVLHDWGAYWGYAMHNRYPHLAARVVGVDVAPHVQPSPLIVAYQALLALCFMIGGVVGDAITRFFASKTDAPRPRDEITCWMNYPYRNAFEDLFSGAMRENEAGYWPAMPILYVWGTRKPVTFHTQAWLDHVTRHGGEAIPLDVGHWASLHPDFTGILTRFLDRTEARAATLGA